MFLRADERPKPRRSGTHEGVRVTYPNDVRHFFPGSEPVALALAALACPPELFEHVGTTVDFGEKAGPDFALKKRLRGPKLASDAARDFPTVLGVPRE